MSHELSSTLGGEGSSDPGTALVTYSANDLALCSTEEARACLPFESASKIRALPLALVRSGGVERLFCAAAVATEDTVRALEFMVGKGVTLSVAPAELLEEAIIRAYLGSDRRIKEKIEGLTRSLALTAQRTLSDLPKASGDAARFLSTLLEFAVARGASDLHLCPSAMGAVVRLRIDGELLCQDEQPYPLTLHEQIVSRLKVLAGLDITCKRLPQDGAFTFSVGAATKCFRLSTLPAVNGESVVLRLLYSRALPKLSALGIEPVTLGLLRKAISKSHGIVLLTGPTGSGKTTTMYSLALELQQRGRNVVAVEDPVEAPIPGMVQVQVREPQGLDYPKAIRSVLRHDPDVILIGEMRDAASARIALTAACTGHLTISSLHMASALHAAERLRSFDIPARQSGEGISLVLNQRLLPRLCERCKSLDAAASERLRHDVYTPRGCRSCAESGYDGRVLVSECLDLQSPHVKEIYSTAGSLHEALSLLPSAAFIPWTYSLQYHLSQSSISPAQVDLFIEEEMGDAH